MRRVSVGLVGLGVFMLAVLPAVSEQVDQSLVRTVEIEGELVRQVRSGDSWFRTIDGLVTVRFNPSVRTLQNFRAGVANEPDDVRLLGNLEVVRVNRLGIYDLAVPAGEDAFDLASRFRDTGLVRWAEVPTMGKWVATPNDPQFGSQYALRNTGQSGGTIDADIDADEAWDTNAGQSNIIVGVLDSGTEFGHEDLAANMWKNPGEIPNNSVDDDSNGFVDDYDGWDFEGNDGDPSTTFNHGTMVAGMVAAVTDNGIGIAGTAGGGFGFDGARIMPVKVGTNGPIGAILDEAIMYAADNGARVITMSLTVGESAAINNALDYAYNTRGVFIDCAAGNNGISVGYPARRPEVQSVAASDRFDQKASYSNPGPENEVTAPGSSILSTSLNDSYATGSGTSFAAPHVAGAAAVVLSQSGSTTAAGVRQLLIDTAEDIGPAGFDNGTGFGRINIRAALDALDPCPDGDADGFFGNAGCGTDVDCDDNDPNTFPGATEICGDSKDNNCDGSVDEGCPCADNDADGVTVCDGDCDDDDPTVFPGAPEICKDGIDQDCDGRDKRGGCGGGGGGGDPTKENCKNGVDDDGDGDVDCADSECSSKPFCN